MVTLELDRNSDDEVGREDAWSVREVWLRRELERAQQELRRGRIQRIEEHAVRLNREGR